MFIGNEVISRDQKMFRILFIDDGKAALFSLEDADQGKISYSFAKLESLCQEELRGSCKKISDPYAPLVQKTPKSQDLSKAMAAYNLLAPALEDPNVLHSPALCTLKLKEIANGDASLLRKLYRLLSRYFQRGQSINALLPDYRKVGKNKQYTRPPGRKSADGSKAAVCDDKLKLMMDKIIKQRVLVENGMSLEKAYAALLNLYKDSNPGATDLPTLGQLRYFYYSNYDRRRRNQSRCDAITANKDIFCRNGSAASTAKGIGDVYEIDSTIDNVYLVAAYDRTVSVGRPVLYLVTDRYSGLITGCYVGLEHAKYSAAADALFCAISNKKSYFEENYGIKTNWVAQDLPAHVCSDNAELEGRQIELCARRYTVNQINTAPFCPHQKGNVESAIGQVQKEVAFMLSRYSCNTDRRDLKKEGARDNRLNGVLTLNEYRALVVRAIEIINSRYTKNRPPFFPSRGKRSPADIWNWAAATNRSEHLKTTDLLSVRISLLPSYPAAISREGIKCQKLHYDCKALKEQGMFDRDHFGHRSTAARMVIDQGNVANAWIFPDFDHKPDVFYACRLCDDYAYFDGCTFYEAQLLLEDAAAARSATKKHQHSVRSENQKLMEGIIEEACAKTRQATTQLSDKQRLAQTAQSRIEQREQDLKERAIGRAPASALNDKAPASAGPADGIEKTNPEHPMWGQPQDVLDLFNE